MRLETLNLLRCPFCGSSVELNAGVFHRIEGNEIHDALLACRCCEFLVTGGIAVMTLWPEAEDARRAIAEERPADALRAMLKFEEGAAAAALIGDDGRPRGTYRQIAEGVGEGFEGGYFVYRFSDPTFVVADIVARALASQVLDERSRALDLCGGSGHLTRTLVRASTVAPVVTDISFVKLWLARHFTAPEADAVLADSEVPLPFATGAFRLVICNDAFHYIWHKAALAREMWRVTDSKGVAAITHTHNAETWTPSQGTALTAEHYASLFERSDARVYSEQATLADAITQRLDLSRRDAQTVLAPDQAFFVVAPNDPRVFQAYELPPPIPRGQLAFSPLYEVTTTNGKATLTLRYPSTDYEEEYAASRTYLPEVVTIDRPDLEAMQAGRLTDRIRDLMARRVIVDLPEGYL